MYVTNFDKNNEIVNKYKVGRARTVKKVATTISFYYTWVMWIRIRIDFPIREFLFLNNEMQSMSFGYNGNGNGIHPLQYGLRWAFMHINGGLQNFVHEILILFLISFHFTSFQEEFCFWIPTLSNRVCVKQLVTRTTFWWLFLKTAFSPQRTNANTSSVRASKRDQVWIFHE